MDGHRADPVVAVLTVDHLEAPVVAVLMDGRLADLAVAVLTVDHLAGPAVAVLRGGRRAVLVVAIQTGGRRAGPAGVVLTVDHLEALVVAILMDGRRVAPTGPVQRADHPAAPADAIQTGGRCAAPAVALLRDGRHAVPADAIQTVDHPVAPAGAIPTGDPLAAREAGILSGDHPAGREIEPPPADRPCCVGRWEVLAAGRQARPDRRIPALAGRQGRTHECPTPAAARTSIQGPGREVSDLACDRAAARIDRSAGRSAAGLRVSAFPARHRGAVDGQRPAVPAAGFRRNADASRHAVC